MNRVNKYSIIYCVSFDQKSLMLVGRTKGLNMCKNIKFFSRKYLHGYFIKYFSYDDYLTNSPFYFFICNYLGKKLLDTIGIIKC